MMLCIIAASCSDNEKGKQFTVSGTISNSDAKMIYLEEVPAGSNQGTIVDSSALDKNGKYSLGTDMKEAVVYNVRQDQHVYPLAAIINDAPAVKLDIVVSSKDRQFAEKYEVSGSPASEEMKDFMYNFNNDLHKIYVLSVRVDSLQRSGTVDSVLAPLNAEKKTVAQGIRDKVMRSLLNPTNPALFIFQLGYFQSTANDQRIGLAFIDIEEVVDLVNKAAVKFPSHTGLAAVKASLDKQLAQRSTQVKEPRWIGKAAPDFSLPDVNGKEIRLSSLRGKYVLVDFWASWCMPCRQENPNVVAAFNQFKNKNFTILGVSLDEYKNKWLEAISADGLDWPHVSDLKYWDSAVIPLYGIESIPYNVLIDPEGNVVAEDLRGRGLISTLEQVLK